MTKPTVLTLKEPKALDQGLCECIFLRFRSSPDAEDATHSGSLLLTHHDPSLRVKQGMLRSRKTGSGYYYMGM